MVRKLMVVAYRNEWPGQYQIESILLLQALGDAVVRAHHIGSTAVPQLAAKPIIDILLEVRSLTCLDAQDAAMEDLGYRPRGEAGIPGRRYYAKGGDARTHHVHAFVEGDSHIEEHLAFRDYLRVYPNVAEEYATIKYRASQQHAFDSERYVAFKHDYVEEVVKQAVHWFRQQGHAN